MSVLSPELEKLSLRPDRLRLRGVVKGVATFLFGLVVAVTLLVWAQDERPAIVAGIDSSHPGYSARWRQRLAERFPAGTPESVLARELRAEGFSVDAQYNTAIYQWGGGGIINTLQVAWHCDRNGRIVSIDGEASLITW